MSPPPIARTATSRMAAMVRFMIETPSRTGIQVGSLFNSLDPGYGGDMEPRWRLPGVGHLVQVEPVADGRGVGGDRLPLDDLAEVLDVGVGQPDVELRGGVLGV